MTIGDQVRRIEPSDQVVLDSDGNVVGIKSGKSSGLEGRMLLPTTADAVQALVSGAVIPSGDVTGGLDRIALQAAHDSLPATGGAITLGAGVFYLGSTVMLSKPCKFIGAGGGIAGDAGTAVTTGPTCINYLNATGDAIYVSAAGCTFRDFSLVNTSATTPTSGAGIRDVSANTTTFDSITVVGFYNLLHLSGVYYSISNCRFYDGVNFYIYHNSLSVPYDDHGDFVISGCVLSGWKKSYTAVAQLRWEAGGGLRIIGNKFNGATQPGSGSSGIAQRAIQLLVRDGVSTGSLTCVGNSISGVASVCLMQIGQLGPVFNGSFTSVNIASNEFAVGAQGITIEGNVTYDDKIKGFYIGANTFSYITAASAIKARYIRGLHIGTNFFTNCTSPLIDLPDLVANSVAMRIDKQHYSPATGAMVVVRDNRGFGSDTQAVAGGVEYDYTHGVYIVAQSTWAQVFKIEAPSSAGGSFKFQVDGRSTDATNTSPNRKGVSLIQERAFDVTSAGVVSLTTIGTDVAAGAAAGFVAVRYVLTANFIGFEVQTTDATNLKLLAMARLRVNGKLQTFQVGV